MTYTTEAIFARFEEWYAEARASGLTYPDAMTLATADTNGQPSARVVLLKAHDTRGFTFFTNFTSRKSQQIKINPRAALCLYWEPLGKQVRIEGRIEPTSEAESDAYFATRPRDSQIGAWASLQSSAMQDRDDLKTRFAEIAARYEGQNIPRPPHWGGWRVVPHRIEFWEEAPHRLHRRDVYTRTADGWMDEMLYP